METGDKDLADAIDDAQLKSAISVQSVSHLLFTFSGNDPTPQLRSGLEYDRGTIPQNSVGLRMPARADFVRAVYEKVIANGDDG
jgi:lipoprotein NlpI